jgi:hypothetical protein
MSDMLSEAIVDAKALRATALKNAENIVIEKYSTEVKKTLETILEQEEGVLAPDLEGAPLDDAPLPEPDFDAPEDTFGEPEAEEEIVEGDDIPLAATIGLSDMTGTNLSDVPSESTETEVTIDLGALQEAVKALGDDLDEEIEITEEDIVDILSEDDEELEEAADGGPVADAAYTDAEDEDDTALKTSAATNQDATSGYGGTDESLDSLVDSILEKLTVDMGAELSGWAGRPTSQLKHEQERALAGAQTDDVKEDLEDLNKAQEELVAENNQLKEHNEQYKQAFNELRGNLQEVNLSNARLLYTNRVLRNTSLNERQKDKIAEAISSAGSVAEARTIYETLQSTVEAAPRKSPQSLSEAIGRRSTVLRATRQEVPSNDPFQDRMKRLAGIK